MTRRRPYRGLQTLVQGRSNPGTGENAYPRRGDCRRVQGRLLSNAESQSSRGEVISRRDRRERRVRFQAGALPQTPDQSRTISSRSGYGAAPHLQKSSLCSLWLPTSALSAPSAGDKKIPISKNQSLWSLCSLWLPTSALSAPLRLCVKNPVPSLTSPLSRR